MVVDLPRCGLMLSLRVPNLVPIPGPRMERETPGQRPRPNYGHPQALTAEIEGLDAELLALCERANPALLGTCGVGAEVASALLVAAGDNP